MFGHARLLPLLVAAAVLVPAAPALAANCPDFPSQLAAQLQRAGRRPRRTGPRRRRVGLRVQRAAPRGRAEGRRRTGAESDADANPDSHADDRYADADADADRDTECARILSVADGDTVKVRTTTGRRLTVRLIGVDTPETRKPGRPNALRQFSHEFVEGMVTDHRTRILGDGRESAPEHWQWGAPGCEPVHVLVLLFAPNDEAIAPRSPPSRRR